MITQLRIQNFKSLRDVTLDLQRVNLLIGPNNCGKTNVLKALKFFSEFLDGVYPDSSRFQSLIFQKGSADDETRINVKNRPLIAWQQSLPNTENPIRRGVSVLQIIEVQFPSYGFALGLSSSQIEDVTTLTNAIALDNACEAFTAFYSNMGRLAIPPDYENKINKENQKIDSLNEKIRRGFWFYKDQNEKFVKKKSFLTLNRFISNTVDTNTHGQWRLYFMPIYRPDPTKILGPYPVVNEESVTEDASNLVAFLHIMRNKYHDVYKRIEEDLQRFVPEFTAISFEIVDVDINDPVRIKYPDKSYEKIGLLDNQKRTFWAEDLSEGILYFLALLAIIHQPHPPKILLLEEPEKGIHPRRIREVLDLIFELAEEKDIQVIMTTHSPLVVDRFSDIPESVFILEKPENETIVKNLQRDVIEPMNEKFREAGEEPIPYTDALGEHWAMGFLGGVPNV